MTAPALLDVNVWELIDNRPALDVLLPVLREIKRRKDHPYYAYKPDDNVDGNQLGFHKGTTLYRLLFGANRSGKSRAVAQEIVWYLTGEHPYQPVPKECRIWLVSAAYRTIKEGVYAHVKNVLPMWMVADVGPMIQGGWDIPSYIRMKNGNELNFISGEGKEDARKKVQGAEIDILAVDEEIDGVLMEELLVRIGSRGGRVMVSATLLRSEQWCLDLEDRAALGDPDVQLFRLTAKRAVERGHLSAKVVKEWENTFSEENREVRIEGKSRRHQGLIYKEFSEKNVIDDQDIPADWTRYCAIDPGWRTCAVLWIAVSPSNKCFVYREHYWHGAKYREILDNIFAAEGYREMQRETLLSADHPELGTKMEKVWVFDENKTEEIQIHWIDPSAFGHEVSGELKIGHLLASEGLTCAPARNDRELGIELCRRSIMADWDGVPALRVFRSCANFLKEIRSYRVHQDTSGATQNEKPGLPPKKNDHLLDAWRYMALGGLEYVPVSHERRAYEKKIRDLERLQTTTRMDERLRRDRLRSLRREEFGRDAEIEHVGGLGTDY